MPRRQLSYVVRKSAIHGRGVFARKTIPANVKIGTFTGSRTTRNSTYVLWIIDEDGTEIGIRGDSGLRFLNHAANPNAAFEDAALWSRRRIAAGAEITIDYGPDWRASPST